MKRLNLTLGATSKPTIFLICFMSIIIPSAIIVSIMFYPKLVWWYVTSTTTRERLVVEKDGVWIARYIMDGDNIQEIASAIHKEQNIEINVDNWMINKSKNRGNIWACHLMPVDEHYLVIRMDKGLYWITKEEMNKYWNFKTNKFVVTSSHAKTMNQENGGVDTEKGN